MAYEQGRQQQGGNRQGGYGNRQGGNQRPQQQDGQRKEYVEKIQPLEAAVKKRYEAAIAKSGAPTELINYVVLYEKNPYMLIPGRLLWFRHKHPKGQVVTHALEISREYAAMRAEVCSEAGYVLASGHGTGMPQARKFGDTHAEKAETMAIGRALAMAGFGLAALGFHSDSEFDLGDRLDVAPARRDEVPPSPAIPPWEAALADALRKAGAPNKAAADRWLSEICASRNWPLPKDMKAPQIGALLKGIATITASGKLPQGWTPIP